MFRIITKFFLVIFFWGIFAFTVLQIPYPETITQASLIQLGSFFIPLFFALTLTLNVFLKNIFISDSISLGLIFLLILKALNSLNFVTTILTVVAIYLLISYFGKTKINSLTKWPKIPKLTRLKRGN